MYVELNPFSDIPFHYTFLVQHSLKGWELIPLMDDTTTLFMLEGMVTLYREMYTSLEIIPPKKQSTLCYKVVRRKNGKLFSCCNWSDEFVKEYVPNTPTIPNEDTYLFVFSDKATALSFAGDRYDWEVWECETELVDGKPYRPVICGAYGIRKFWEIYHSSDIEEYQDTVRSKQLRLTIILDKDHISQLTEYTKFAKRVTLLNPSE